MHKEFEPRASVITAIAISKGVLIARHRQGELRIFCRLSNLNTLFKIVAFALLALWLPATQHCDLEAADFPVLGSGAHHPDTCKEVCKADACHTIESVSYVTAANNLKVLPPTASLVSCLLALLTTPVLVERGPVCLDADTPEIQALHRTWQFVRRTALPARAPNCVA